MKRILLIGSLFALGIISACAPTPPNEVEVPVTLDHNPATKQLTVAAPSKTLTATLSCGCPFAITIVNAGDTSIIKYSIPTKNDELSAHSITVSANPTGLASGTYTSFLALQTPDPRVTFLRDTLRDTLIVP